MKNANTAFRRELFTEELNAVFGGAGSMGSGGGGFFGFLGQIMQQVQQQQGEPHATGGQNDPAQMFQQILQQVAGHQ